MLTPERRTGFPFSFTRSRPFTDSHPFSPTGVPADANAEIIGHAANIIVNNIFFIFIFTINIFICVLPSYSPSSKRLPGYYHYEILRLSARAAEISFIFEVVSG